MTSWHPSFVPSGGPRGLVLVHVRDDTGHLELRGTLQLTKREYEDLAARLAGDHRQLLAALEQLVDAIEPLPKPGGQS